MSPENNDVLDRRDETLEAWWGGHVELHNRDPMAVCSLYNLAVSAFDAGYEAAHKELRALERKYQNACMYIADLEAAQKQENQ